MELDEAYNESTLALNDVNSQEAATTFLEKHETISQKTFTELSNKLTTIFKNCNILTTCVTKTYEGLLNAEAKLTNVARNLGVPYACFISNTTILDNMQILNENINKIQAQIKSITLDDITCPEDASNLSSTLTNLVNKLNLACSLTDGFSESCHIYKLQLEGQIKKSLYARVQSVIKNAKTQKYKMQHEELMKQYISFWGRLFGKDKLRDEKIKNINLKLKLLDISSQISKKFSVREMLSDLYACAIQDFDGVFTPEMEHLYIAITDTYEDSKTGKFTDEYIGNLAKEKLLLENHGSNLPAVYGKQPKFFNKTKYEINTLKLQNENLQNQIAKMELINCVTDSTFVPDSLLLFEKKLAQIVDILNKIEDL